MYAEEQSTQRHAAIVQARNFSFRVSLDPLTPFIRMYLRVRYPGRGDQPGMEPTLFCRVYIYVEFRVSSPFSFIASNYIYV